MDISFCHAKNERFKKTFAWYRWDCADIGGVIVLPKYRGNHLQKILIQSLEEAKRKGNKNIIVEITLGNKYSLNNFEKLGYEIRNSYKKYIHIERYLLVKNIDWARNSSFYVK